MRWAITGKLIETKIVLITLNFSFKASKYNTEDLVDIILGDTKETKDFHKYRRLSQNDKSFTQSYERSLAIIQIQISKKHRELKQKDTCDNKVKQQIRYAECLMKHWGVYFWIWCK